MSSSTGQGPVAEAGWPPGSVPDRLSKAATRLFAERGFESASVQDIVAAAGVTKGAMYHYFDSKDDLLYAIYHRLLAVQTARLETFAAAGGGIEERLRGAAVDVVETTLANLDEMTVFFRSLHMLHAAKQATVRAERRAYHERFRSMVEEGQRAGVIRADIPPDMVVFFLFGALHDITTWYRPDGPLGAREIGHYYAELLLGGLRTDAAAAWPGAGGIREP
jgi:AcrR family transcriptional regulator